MNTTTTQHQSRLTIKPHRLRKYCIRNPIGCCTQNQQDKIFNCPHTTYVEVQQYAGALEYRVKCYKERQRLPAGHLTSKEFKYLVDIKNSTNNLEQQKRGDYTTCGRSRNTGIETNRKGGFSRSEQVIQSKPNPLLATVAAGANKYYLTLYNQIKESELHRKQVTQPSKSHHRRTSTRHSICPNAGHKSALSFSTHSCTQDSIVPLSFANKYLQI